MEQAEKGIMTANCPVEGVSHQSVKKSSREAHGTIC